MLHHVTYHIPAEDIEGPRLKLFMAAHGLHEVDVPDWELQAAGSLVVRWFQSGSQDIAVHIVAALPGDSSGAIPERGDQLALGHFCVAVGHARMKNLKRTRWCVRDSGKNDRIWTGFSNLRVEVRP